MARDLGGSDNALNRYRENPAWGDPKKLRKRLDNYARF
jgi:hypothetical protein